MLQSKCCHILKWQQQRKKKLLKRGGLFKSDGEKITFLSKSLGKPVCLVCGDAFAVMKKSNLECHCISMHAKLNELSRKMQQDKISALQQSLESQATFANPSDSDKIIQASYAVSQLIS